jgi:hypothetical protein
MSEAGPSFKPTIQASTPPEQKRPVVAKLIDFFSGKSNIEAEDKRQLGIIKRTLARLIRQQRYPEQ